MRQSRLTRLAVALGIVAVSCTVGVSVTRAARSGSIGQRAAAAAITQLGEPYVWGQESPATGFDSSGLVVWAFGRVGRAGLPHYTQDLWRLGQNVSRADLRVGDLVFFNGLGHVGIYVGHGRFVHAPDTGAVVRTESLVSGFYASHYVGAVRLTA